MNLQDIKNLLINSDNSQALLEIDRLVDPDNLQVKLLKSRILYIEHDLNGALNISNQILDKCRTEEHRKIEFCALSIWFGCMFNENADLKATYQYLSRAEKLLQSFTLLEMNDLQEYIGIHLFNKGVFEYVIYFWDEPKTYVLFEVNLESALNYLNQAVVAFQAASDKYGMAKSYNKIGEILQKKGNFESALKFLKKSMKISQQVGYTRAFVISNQYIGLDNLMRGKLDASLTIYMSCLEISEREKFDIVTAYNLRIIGRLFFVRGDLKTSLIYFEKALTKSNMIGSNTESSCNLFNLTLTSLELDNNDQANKYLNQLQELNKINNSRIIDLRTKLAKALIFKRAKRVKYKVDSQRILEEISDQIIDEDNLYVFSMFNLCTIHELTVFAMLNLCEILLIELKNFEEDEVLQQAVGITQKIRNIARNQNSNILVVETLLLEAKFAIIKLDFSKAEKLLIQSSIITIEQNLQKLSIKVENEKKLFQSEMDRIAQLAQKSAKVQDNIKHARIEEYLTTMIKLYKYDEDADE